MELFEKSWSNFLLYLLGFVIIGCSISQGLSITTEKTPHCVWYGECATKNSLKQNCPYDGLPKSLDHEGQKILSKWCPEFMTDKSDGIKTCCDTAQARTFDRNIGLIETILKDTPCFHNFLKQVCALTCSPEQSRFLNVTEVKIDPNGTKYINSIDYYISNSYMTGTFNSCKQVRLPEVVIEEGGPEWALDILCGYWGSESCTPTRWFHTLGDANNNLFVPFYVNYINTSISVNDFVPMNATIEPYDVSMEIDDAQTTANLINEELARFEDLQNKIANEKLNVTVLFSQTRFDDDSDFLQSDSVGFQPLLGKDHTKNLDVLEPLDEKSIELLFAFADRLNFTAVVSQEKFAADGSILSKYIYTGDMTIFYENGNSNMVYKNRAIDQLDDIDLSDFLTLLKDYEIPAKVHKVLYNEEGEVIKTDDMEHTPEKVKILESHNMKIDRQMKVSEALKRTIVMKEDPVDRMTLLCKYLGIQYPGTNWEAVMGSGHHYIKEHGLVKLLLEGEIYTVYTTTEDSEDTEED